VRDPAGTVVIDTTNLNAFECSEFAEGWTAELQRDEDQRTCSFTYKDTADPYAVVLVIAFVVAFLAVATCAIVNCLPNKKRK
jgi:hypothetical protein